MLRRGLMVLLCAVCGVLLLGGGSAFAGFTYPFDGQLAPAGGSFEGIEAGVAVDDTSGNAYVADSSAGLVYVFQTSSGTQLASLDGSLTPAGSFGGRGVAVAANDGTGQVYVLDSVHGVVDVFDSAGAYVCQITGSASPSASECNGVAGSDTPAGGFNAPGGIAVDQATGEVYVVDANNGVVDVFSAGGAYERQISLASIPSGFSTLYTHGIAVNDFNGHVYIADSGQPRVYEFNAAGEYVTTWTGANTPAESFGSGYVSVAADDTSGLVYVTDSQHGITDVFESSGEYAGRLSHSPGEPFAVAVGQTSGKVYVADGQTAAVVNIFGPGLAIPNATTGLASGVQPTSATLNGIVNPYGVELQDCHFEYGTDTVYGHSAPCVPAAGAIPADSGEHAVSASIAGLEAGTTYHFRLVATNATDASEPVIGRDATFTTLPPPTIEDISARNVTATAADLSAQVNPNGYDTTYRIELGTSTAYGTNLPVPDEDLGAGSTSVAVSRQLTGLAANTTYHWRVVARNANGTTTTGDHTFIYSTVGAGLPDNRAYEMVTPAQKNAAFFGPALGLEIVSVIAEDGSRAIVPSIGCLQEASSCSATRGPSTGDPYEFSRTPEGWVTSSLAPPGGAVAGWRLVNADAGSALLTIPTAPSNEDDWYTRGSEGSLADVGPVTPPLLGELGSSETFPLATADLSHVVWLGLPVWPFDESQRGGIGSAGSVYEYAGAAHAAPVLVGVTGGAGSTDLISVCRTSVAPGVPGSLSTDGRVVFFTAEQCPSGSGANAGVAVPTDEIWARIDESRSVLISGRSAGDCFGVCLSSPESRPAFLGASADGSKAFFTSVQQLTNNASQDPQPQDGATPCSGTSGVNGCNLYMYDFANPAGRNLVTMSAGDTSGGGPRVQGVAGISADGSHVYFVAQGVLSRAANDRGESAKNGSDNLYVFERDAAHPEGRTTFITTLLQADKLEWSESREANVTPDGQFLVFTSYRNLTADDTSVSGASQVFRYDAQSGQLARVSIGDQGFDDNGNRPTNTPCTHISPYCSENVHIAPPRFTIRAGEARLDPTMSHDGSYVFFTSPVALAPGALDDVQVGRLEENPDDANTPILPQFAQNVYEWHEGRVHLISDGRDVVQHGEESDVQLLGSDATGANVFFSTADPLVPGDTDTQLDIYDARICTAGDPCVRSVAPVDSSCQGDACHAPPGGAPAAPNVASTTFAGPGNLTPPAVVTHKKAVVKKHGKAKKRKRQKKKTGRRHKTAVRGRGKSGGRS